VNPVYISTSKGHFCLIFNLLTLRNYSWLADYFIDISTLGIAQIMISLGGDQNEKYLFGLKDFPLKSVIPETYYSFLTSPVALSH